MKGRFSVLIALCFLGFSLNAQTRIELGKIDWLRNYEEALSISIQEDKPIFILFQEVPGCSTCRNYGKDVLSHPLIVEAIEDLFVPLAIYNNETGHDAEILKKFNEPSWNNPVIRILDNKEQQLVPRVAREYSAVQLVRAMNTALGKDNRPIPGYLNLLEEELTTIASGVQETYFSMYCYWSGEKNIAKQRGVLYTEAGFMDGKEVVKVTYSPEIVSYKKLLKHASNVQCASSTYTDDKLEIKESEKVIGNGKQYATKAYKKAHDDKYYLNRSDLKSLELTLLQKTRVNSMLGQGLDPSHILSPRQLASLN